MFLHIYYVINVKTKPNAEHLICMGASFSPPFAANMLAFGAGTFGFVPVLLKLLLDGKWWVETWFAFIREGPR